MRGTKRPRPDRVQYGKKRATRAKFCSLSIPDIYCVLKPMLFFHVDNSMLLKSHGTGYFCRCVCKDQKNAAIRIEQFAYKQPILIGL